MSDVKQLDLKQSASKYPELKKVVALLKKHYGEPALPPAHGPFELVFWENACYLLSDERRAAVFEAVREQVGITAEAIWKAPKEVLLPLATMGGMRPETRVFRWREIARITLQQFDGNLDSILQLPYPQAKRSLHQFPNIGEPGAEKILMYCGLAAGLPLEWNGVRVLERLGYARAQKNYGATYKALQEAVKPQLPRGAAPISRTHLLLRQHGKTLCKNARPLCEECPLSSICAYPAKR
jgi:endonuclease III